MADARRCSAEVQPRPVVMLQCYVMRAVDVKLERDGHPATVRNRDDRCLQRDGDWGAVTKRL